MTHPKYTYEELETMLDATVPCLACKGTGKRDPSTNQVTCDECGGDGHRKRWRNLERQKLISEYIRTPEGRRKLSGSSQIVPKQEPLTNKEKQKIIGELLKTPEGRRKVADSMTSVVRRATCSCCKKPRKDGS